MMAEFVGEGNGLRETDLDYLAPLAADILTRMNRDRQAGRLPFLELPHRHGMIRHIQDMAVSIRDRCDDFVVLGIGGSALGATALKTALLPPHADWLPPERRRRFPRLLVADNIDSDGFAGLMDSLNPRRTVFNVVSKSGGTAETVTQFLVVREFLRQALGEEFRHHIVVTTDARKGPLREMVQRDGYRSMEVPDGVGGRFSVLSAVGLLPAAVAGIDIEALMAGARQIEEFCLKDRPEHNPACMAASLLYLAEVQLGKRLHVMMPYADRLRDIADWFRQLWAESLGKVRIQDGKKEHVGPTPIRALGATDQHSQLQLYMEGPPDKVVIFLRPVEFHRSVTVPEIHLGLDELDYLGGHTMEELLLAEQRATELALARNGRPSLTFHISRVTPSTVGGLLLLLEVQTAIAGWLYGVDPFDQPGVEEGKRYASGMMGRKGYEQWRKEVERAAPRRDKWIMKCM